KGVGIRVVAVDIAKQFQHLGKSIAIDTAVVLQAIFGASLQLIERPSGLGNPDNRDVETFVANEPLDGSENLLICEIAGGAKEHQRVGLKGRHQGPPIMIWRPATAISLFPITAHKQSALPESSLSPHKE